MGFKTILKQLVLISFIARVVAELAVIFVVSIISDKKPRQRRNSTKSDIALSMEKSSLETDNCALEGHSLYFMNCASPS
jgi:hypothetical protein